MTDGSGVQRVAEIERAVVFHDFYGCDTGCCGHSVVIYRGTDEVRRKFYFEHPYGAYRYEGEARTAFMQEFAQDMVDTYNREMGSAAVLDFAACELIDD